ncbi:SusD/RagB family nutrient-binding outer membrane lipoprotein [Ilyomonas limi]|uniref:SusD/RagB family nutrient-binding outer membrane lipoprotein n=1 Tax=Ilyomonas limi TaxID=2575867 RepID=A0A4U3KYL6_9BACT|nr:SusD/RagB family nutrient-binding outer membrane lipoprotein [Ilyomonas limi]TKK67755.1 SusD/RagB family nutrient-binding outer membrane lipoprotein [Ilyomonas limi]
MSKYKSVIFLLLSVITIAGCKKENFVKENTNPEILTTIDPAKEFLNATLQMHNQRFEAYYDYYRRIMPWMQMDVAQTGNSKTLVTDIGNFGTRYGIFYPTLGAEIEDLHYIINTMPEDEKASYVYMSNIADILKIYYAFYVSDIYGSIPYREAFQGRYGGTVTPVYEPQQELFALWDSSLHAIATTLETTQPTAQVSLGANDLYFQGDVTKWSKVANALRLRIAFRLSKRDEAAAKAIFADVLSDNNQMASNDDSWAFYASPALYDIYRSNGDWDISSFKAPRPTVNFMIENSDPRIRDYYEKNNYTQANINVAIDSNILAPGTVEKPNRYVGAPISPDSAQGKYKSWFTPKFVNGSLILDTISFLKRRLWNADYSGGTGIVTTPVITYADYCFMRAEIEARGFVTTGGTAEEWYNKGVEASIRFWDDAANKAQTEDYTAVTDAEITAYLMAPDVQFDASKALEQIAVQSYINFEKQPNEAWALWKRTGMPNSNTALALENIVIDGTVKAIPRRAAISLPASNDPNYANKEAAIQQMQQDPGFGSGPSDVFGRVWWDAQ